MEPRRIRPQLLEDIYLRPVHSASPGQLAAMAEVRRPQLLEDMYEAATGRRYDPAPRRPF